MRRPFNSKKGQFYIFVAVIFCSLALTLVLSNFGTRGYRIVFENVKDNFVSEAPNVINSALFTGANLTEQFEEFALYYQDYAKTRNVNFRILYFIVHNGILQINNLLDFDIGVATALANYQINSSTMVELEKPEYVDVTVDDYVTHIPFTNDTTQIKMYFRLGVLK